MVMMQVYVFFSNDEEGKTYWFHLEMHVTRILIDVDEDAFYTLFNGPGKIGWCNTCEEGIYFGLNELQYLQFKNICDLCDDIEIVEY